MIKERGVWLREEGKECGSHECFELKQEDKIQDICLYAVDSKTKHHRDLFSSPVKPLHTLPSGIDFFEGSGGFIVIIIRAREIF